MLTHLPEPTFSLKDRLGELEAELTLLCPNNPSIAKEFMDGIFETLIIQLRAVINRITIQKKDLPEKYNLIEDTINNYLVYLTGQREGILNKKDYSPEDIQTLEKLELKIDIIRQDIFKKRLLKILEPLNGAKIENLILVLNNLEEIYEGQD